MKTIISVISLPYVALLIALTSFYPSLHVWAAQDSVVLTMRTGAKNAIKGKPFIQCAMGHMAQSYEIKEIPWKRAQRMTESGQVDGFFMASKNDYRDTYATFSNPFLITRWYYVTGPASRIHPEQDDFANNVFIANSGSDLHIWLNKNYQKVLDAKTPEQVLKMTLIKRTDVALMNDSQLNRALNTLKLTMDDINTFTVKESKLGVYFGHIFLNKKPSFLQAFNISMSRCSE